MSRKPHTDGGKRPSSAFEDLKHRFKPFPRSGIIDPSDAELAPEYGVPPRPPANAPAALLDNWDRMFGSRLFMQAFEVTEKPLEKPAPAIRRRVIDAIDSPGSVEDSRNWAGAYATAYGGEHFHTLFGFWQIPPEVTIPVDENPADFACSVWIGLDGQRRYFDSSLPQIGTWSTGSATGKSSASSWVQWWERDSPNNQILPLGLPVSPGDEIGCFLHATDLHDAWFVMVNLSALPPRPAKACRTLAPDPILGVQPAIFGATAEWIVERPTKPATTTLYEFPNFIQCQIEGVALQVPAIGQSPWYGGTLRDMSYARRLRMIEPLSDPSRTAIIAMPHRAGPYGVNVTYGGF